MSSKAYLAPIGLLLKLCDPQGHSDWDDDDDEYVEEQPVDAGVDSIDCGVDDGGLVDAGLNEDGSVIGCDLLRGLYVPGSCEELSDDSRPYRPRYPLWSDGAEKERYVYLPPNARIDATDPDFWVYPDGTRLYKTFLQNGVKLETRIIEKADGGWSFKAFAWREDQRGVDPAPVDGGTNVLGTQHDIPSENDCLRCHTRGGQDGINGFSAIQLNHEFTETSLADLIAEDVVRSPLGEDLIEQADVPGSPLAQDALGYMHSNCGVCHGGPKPRAGLGTRLRVHDSAVHHTAVYQDAVNIPLGVWVGPKQIDEPAIDRPFDVPYVYRIISGHPDKSGIIARMGALDPGNRMPPLATEIVDEQGRAIVSTWIASLQPRIYPPWRH